VCARLERIVFQDLERECRAFRGGTTAFDVIVYLNFSLYLSYVYLDFKLIILCEYLDLRQYYRGGACSEK
jgi:hypothetical protein